MERLRERSDFVALRRGLVWRGPLFTVQASREPREQREPNDGGPVRVGFTVTKKVGNAVERNRIKRRLRAAVREVALPPALAGRDVVLIARREVLDAPFDRLCDEIVRGVTRALQPRAKRPERNVGRRAAP